MCKKSFSSPITVYLARECEKLRERSKSDRKYIPVALDLMNASITRRFMRGF